MNLKERFIEEVKAVGTPQIISVAVKLPSGAIEVITNTQELYLKLTIISILTIKSLN